MSTRPFRCDDLLKFNNINLDVLTETFNCSFYYEYLSRWPGYFAVQVRSAPPPLACACPATTDRPPPSRRRRPTAGSWAT